MSNILFINEEYFKKNISHKQSFDTNQVISTIRLVQKTNLVSIISETIYEVYQTKLADNTEFTESEESLFNLMQLFLAVKSAQELILANPSGVENDGSDLVYSNKAVLIEARMVRIINNDSDLLALAQSGTDEFNDVEMSNQGGFYFD